jgi:DNA-binding NarL/FixJ family response regulator
MAHTWMRVLDLKDALDNVSFKGVMVPRNCVLIVDDNAAIRRSLRRLFEQAGWEVCGEAENGREAISKAEELRPQVVVIDLAMPEMDGLAAGRLLKQRLPTARLMLYTLHGGLVPANELEQSGISAVVSKTTPPDTLLEAAARLVRSAA